MFSQKCLGGKNYGSNFRLAGVLGMIGQRLAPHAALVTLLLLFSLAFPLPLYLAALAIFGLPHVIYELSFLRSRYAARWPLRWWIGLGVVLLLQAAVRLGQWWGSVPSSAGQTVDLLALALLALLVALAPKGAGWPARIGGLILAAAVLWLLDRGEWTLALLVLAMVHNVGPLVMAWDLAREYAPAKPLARGMSALFVLPLLVAGSGWMGALLPPSAGAYAPLLDGLLPLDWAEDHRQAILRSMVLAQCLHYYCIMHLLPLAEARRTAKVVIPPSMRIVTWVAAIFLVGYFISDYGAARRLYAVAAGVHSWLEWPVLLMASLTVARPVVLSATPLEPAEGG